MSPMYAVDEQASRPFVWFPLSGQRHAIDRRDRQVLVGEPMRCLCGGSHPRGAEGDGEWLWTTCERCWEEACRIVGVRYVGELPEVTGRGAGERDQSHEQRKGPTVIREDRELLAELVRLNTDIPTLALRIMEGSASAREQTHYSDRLMAAGERLRQRAEAMGGTVIKGDVVEGQVALT
jgi:zinc finger protein